MSVREAAQVSLISDEMRAAIGREIGRRTSLPIDRSDVRRWAMAVHWPQRPPAHFVDDGAASRTVHGGIVAPEEFNPFAWTPVTEDGEGPDAGDFDPGDIERQLGVTPPDLTFMMNAGIDVEYGERMRPGDVVTSVLTLHDYREKAGRMGPMLFTVLQQEWTNQAGAVVKRNRVTFLRY